jgi:hypothetical protein
MRLGLARGAQALPPAWGWRLSGPNVLLAQELSQPLVDVRHHPLGDQVVGGLGQRPGRKRLAGRVSKRDPLDLLALGQREGRRPAAPMTNRASPPAHDPQQPVALPPA